MPISWRRENDGFIMTHKLEQKCFLRRLNIPVVYFFGPLPRYLVLLAFTLNGPTYREKLDIII